MKSVSNLISCALIVSGVSGFLVTSPRLLNEKEIDVPLNILGVNRSPYGELIAMAMQGPIENFLGAMESKKAHVCDDSELCQVHHLKAKQQLAIEQPAAWEDRLGHFIEELGKGVEERTNENAASSAHKFYLRRQIENKLRFAYELDPAHYGNYNAYHFFLTMPQFGTRPELTPLAAKLAQETINYCLKRRVDPREALTAAAAAGNLLELMINDRRAEGEDSRYTTPQMRNILKIMDQSIAVYISLTNEWLEKGLWQNLSEMRINEAQERFYFVKKICESHEASIQLIENSLKLK